MEKEKPCIPVVGALLLKKEGDQTFALIQTRYKPGTEHHNSLEFPVGWLREWENVYVGLQREVFEETGLTITHINSQNIINSELSFGFSPWYCTQQKSYGLSWLMLGFVCMCTGELAAQEGETAHLKWIPLEDFAENLSKERLFALQQPFFQRYFEKGADVVFEKFEDVLKKSGVYTTPH